MMKPWEVIQELESDNSRLFKEGVIKRESDADNVEFFKGCKAALDAMVTFGVKDIAQWKGTGKEKGLDPSKFWEVANKLISREYSGNEALTRINSLRLKATKEQWDDWYRRILIKDLRCGVSDKTINKVASEPHQVPVFSCQLAHDGAKHEKKIAGKKLVEVKLDGVRVITIVYPNGTVNQYSRNGKELHNFEKIKQQLAKHARMFAGPTVLDGEVMSANFQDLMKQVHRKDNVEADDAVLHLFDIMSLEEFQRGEGDHIQVDRSKTLELWYRHIQLHMPNVNVVGHAFVDLDTEEGQKYFEDINKAAINEGYEGIMLKDPEAKYVCKRSHSWLKIKPFIEVSLGVIDIEEGTGRNEGRLGAFVCEGEDDGVHIRVNVGSGFSDVDRDAFWADRDRISGQIVEIRADAVTQNQDGTYSLRFPRFLRFRGFEPGEKL